MHLLRQQYFMRCLSPKKKFMTLPIRNMIASHTSYWVWFHSIVDGRTVDCCAVEQEMDPTSCASVINCSRDPNGASCDLSPVEVRQLLTGTACDGAHNYMQLLKLASQCLLHNRQSVV